MNLFKTTLLLPFLIALNICCADQLNDEDIVVWENIRQCIVGVIIDYESGVIVHEIDGAEIVFKKYILHSKYNEQDIFGHGYNWRSDSAEKHGLYKEIKYWKISASWFSDDDQVWRKKEVFDVSENGEVVRLLGCI